MHKDVQIYIWKVEALTMKGLSCPIPIRGEDKMHPSYAVYFPTACMWNFLHLFLKLQFLSLIEFVIVWFSFSTFFFLSSCPSFLKSLFWYAGGRSLAKFFRDWHHLLWQQNATSFMNCLHLKVYVVFGALFLSWGDFSSARTKIGSVKILNIKPMIWEFPISKAQK